MSIYFVLIFISALAIWVHQVKVKENVALARSCKKMFLYILIDLISSNKNFLMVLTLV